MLKKDMVCRHCLHYDHPRPDFSHWCQLNPAPFAVSYPNYWCGQGKWMDRDGMGTTIRSWGDWHDPEADEVYLAHCKPE